MNNTSEYTSAHIDTSNESLITGYNLKSSVSHRVSHDTLIITIQNKSEYNDIHLSVYQGIHSISGWNTELHIGEYVLEEDHEIHIQSSNNSDRSNELSVNMPSRCPSLLLDITNCSLNFWNVDQDHSIENLHISALNSNLNLDPQKALVINHLTIRSDTASTIDAPIGLIKRAQLQTRD